MQLEIKELKVSARRFKSWENVQNVLNTTLFYRIELIRSNTFSKMFIKKLGDECDRRRILSMLVTLNTCKSIF